MPSENTVQPVQPPLARPASMIGSFEKKPENGGIPASASAPIHISTVVQGSQRDMPPMRRMSCSSESAWITTPAPRNSRALKNAWVTRWNMPAALAPSPTPQNM